MVTLNKIGKLDNVITLELYGTSSDVKPMDMIDDRPVTNGSVFVEMDTKKVFIFDKEANRWREF